MELVRLFIIKDSTKTFMDIPANTLGDEPSTNRTKRWNGLPRLMYSQTRNGDQS